MKQNMSVIRNLSKSSGARAPISAELSLLVTRSTTAVKASGWHRRGASPGLSFNKRKPGETSGTGPACFAAVSSVPIRQVLRRTLREGRLIRLGEIPADLTCKNIGNVGGFTLIELLVAVSIASILTAGIQQLLDTALTSWRFAVEEATISQFSEEAIRRMMEGDYELYGIRDAVEVTEAKPHSIGFVPLWTDIFDQSPSSGRFYLSKKMRAGSEPPIGEIKFKGFTTFRTYPTAVSTDETGNQFVEFGFPVRSDSVVRLNYHPDIRTHPELIMRYEWQKESGKIVRSYNHETIDLSLRRDPVRATSVTFTYYDGYNRLVPAAHMGDGSKRDRSTGDLNKDPSLLEPSQLRNRLIRISAVKIDLTFQGHELAKSASSFVNIRALGKSGLGIILAEGVEIPIPNSRQIRVLRLINFSGVSDGQIIELKVKSKAKSREYRLKLYLGSEGGEPILKNFDMFFPSNQLVFQGAPELPLQSGIDLLNLGEEGLYDYDDDEGVQDIVSFTDETVSLEVVRMDPEGVMLVVRP